MKRIDVILSCCKDIARHISCIEAELAGEKQNANRYIECKQMLIKYYLDQSGDYREINRTLQRLIGSVADLDDNAVNKQDLRDRLLCILIYTAMMEDARNEINNQ